MGLGCGGSTTGGSGGGTTTTTSDPIDNGVVKFKLDGADWISAPPGHPEMKFEEEAITDGRTLVKIEALAADLTYFTLTVFNEAGVTPGTYPITNQGMQGFYTEEINAGKAYLTSGMESNPGSVTITTLTEEKVVGTFNFPMRNSADPEDIKDVTEGSFDIKFSYY